jgi:hypothetical protein
VVLFTDGYSTVPDEAEAASLRQKIPDVYAVGMRDDAEAGINTPALEAITGDKTRVYLDKDINQFDAELAKLTADCRQ